jgi:hypothetical protein
MSKNLVIAAVVTCAGLFSALPALAQKHRVEVINVVATAEGDKIRGPRSIKPIKVNRIRYRVAVKTRTSFSAGPSLALPFIPQIPGGGGEAGGASAEEAGKTPLDRANALDTARKNGSAEAEFEAIRLAQQELIRRRATIQSRIANLLADAKTARDATESFVRESNALLAGDSGIDTVLARLPDLILKIGNAEGDWPDEPINGLLADIDIWESELGRISDLAWLAKHKERVDAVKARFENLRDSVTNLSRGGPADGPAARFDEARRVLSEWKAIFRDAQQQKAEYFELPYVDVGCGFSFDQNKETEVKLIKQDRLAPAGTEPTEQELITVVCSSPFSVSGGFGFSTIDEREFVFVQSTKPVTENGQTTQVVINRFGFRNNSSFRPIPLLLLNTRIWEKNDTLAFHISAGAGVDIKTGETGSDVEFIVGPSVSFKRSLFLTAGVHIGRVPKLAGGFVLDQEVPEGIDTPPVEKAWKPGFIFAITYRLR